MNTEYKFEVGGSVLISGKWYEVRTDRRITINGNALNPLMLTDIIQDYRPPAKEQKPFEWLTEADLIYMEDQSGNENHLMRSAKSINAFLTERYGDPTERVYNGEPAEEFGLTKDSWILYWTGYMWGRMAYGHLVEGDIWRKQPPVLTK